jgi:hypothetical protein
LGQVWHVLDLTVPRRHVAVRIADEICDGRCVNQSILRKSEVLFRVIAAASHADHGAIVIGAELAETVRSVSIRVLVEKKRIGL